MKKNLYGILVLMMLMNITSLNAQVVVNKVDTVNIKNDVTITDSIKSTLPGTFSDDNLDIVLGGQLDSLTNTWYVRKAFNVDSLAKVISANVDTQELADSVYISRLQSLDSYIPLPYNEAVKKFINFYLKKRGGQVAIMLGLTNYYFPLFEEALAKYDLPAELRYLPIIESALNPKIVSRAGASGLWQFMHGTGKMYGLEINSYIDERNDPIKSTDAAARYLRDLYAIYGDWHIVIAAYNCGPGNINKAVRRSGGKNNYWEIYSRLPKETRGYIPIFIAANYIMNHAKEHNIFAIQPTFQIKTDTIVIRSYLNFAQISANMDIPIEEIRQLNPQFKRDIVPAKADKPYALKLPVDKISSFIDGETQIFAYNREKYFPNNQIVLKKEVVSGKGGAYTSSYDIDGKKKIVYTVKAGDNPGAIAARFKVNVNNLREWNGIHNMIHIGQKLSVYVNDNSPVGKAQSKPVSGKSVNQSGNANTAGLGIPQRLANSASETAMKSNFTYYTVRQGDSLYTIAKQFSGVSDVEIKTLNNISDSKELTVGQKLKIPVKV
ncbi:MAG: transglycosylase SLT domain-containing protein [Mariniphaga sp.]